VRRKLRLSIVLPVTQVAITAILTFWANRVDWMVFGGDSNRVPGRFARVDLVIIDLRLFWRGVNAPTFPLCMFHGNPTSWTLGLGAGGLLNLLAVGLLWYWVGRFFDRRRGLVPNERQTTARKRVISVLLMAWGIFLLGISILEVRHSLLLFDASLSANLSFLLHFRPYVLWSEALFLLWSLILIIFHGTALAGTMGSGRARSHGPLEGNQGLATRKSFD
jgi:hypothetical protein